MTLITRKQLEHAYEMMHEAARDMGAEAEWAVVKLHIKDLEQTTKEPIRSFSSPVDYHTSYEPSSGMGDDGGGSPNRWPDKEWLKNH